MADALVSGEIAERQGLRRRWVARSLNGVPYYAEEVATEITLGEVEITNDAGNPIPTADVFASGEVLADQTGAAAVLTFTFSAPVELVVVDANGSAADVARADPFGGTPTNSQGIPCRDEVPTYLPVRTSSVLVWAPSGMVVSVWGFRR